MSKSLRSTALMESHHPSLSFQIYASSKTKTYKPKERWGLHEGGSWNTTACIQKCFLLSFLKGSTIIYSSTIHRGKHLSLVPKWHCCVGTSRNALLLHYRPYLRITPNDGNEGICSQQSRSLAIVSVHLLWVERKLPWGYSLMGNGGWLSLLVRTIEGARFQDQEKAVQGKKQVAGPFVKSKSVRTSVPHTHIQNKHLLKMRHVVTEPQDGQ